MPPLDWQKVMARFDEICGTISKCVAMSQTSQLTMRLLLHIDLVADDNLWLSVPWPSYYHRDTYKGKALRVHGAGLNQELVAPAV
jgi:hypothetical protein